MALFARLYWPFKTPFVRDGLHVLSAMTRTILIAHLFVTYGFSWGISYGASMVPTLMVFGDYVLIQKSYRRGRNIVVGDVVQFDSVVEPGGKVIKRVLGLQGDYVLRDSPTSDSQNMIQIPEGHCWVIGDNLPESRDSRHWGPLPMALINGKVIGTLFPWKERRWMQNTLKPVDSS